MTKKEAIEKLKGIQLEGRHDREASHSEAEGVLLDLLKSQGFDDVSKAFIDCRDEVGFWYA